MRVMAPTNEVAVAWPGSRRLVSPTGGRRTAPGRAAVACWTASALLCVQMCFTAYAQLRLPQVARAFAHLGFPGYFRVELACAKLLGAALLLAPVPPRVKEWVYAGFAIDLVSALIAHLSMGDGPGAWGWAVATGLLWAASYVLWRQRADRNPTQRSQE